MLFLTWTPGLNAENRREFLAVLNIRACPPSIRTYPTLWSERGSETYALLWDSLRFSHHARLDICNSTHVREDLNFAHADVGRQTPPLLGPKHSQKQPLLQKDWHNSGDNLRSTCEIPVFYTLLHYLVPTVNLECSCYWPHLILISLKADLRDSPCHQESVPVSTYN